MTSRFFFHVTVFFTTLFTSLVYSGHLEPKSYECTILPTKSSNTDNSEQHKNLEDILDQPGIPKPFETEDKDVITTQPEDGFAQKILKRKYACFGQTKAFYRGTVRYAANCGYCIKEHCPKCATCFSKLYKRINTPKGRIIITCSCAVCLAGMGGLNDWAIPRAAAYYKGLAEGSSDALNNYALKSSPKHCVPNCCCPCCWPCHATVLGVSPCYFTSILCTALCIAQSAKSLCNKIIEHGRDQPDT
jgi:hypothetical protein